MYIEVYVITMKDRVISKAQSVLENNNYKHSRYSGCFDIAAKKDKLILLKVLTNVDSLQREQAENLKIISSHFNAKCFLVGDRTRSGKLDNGIIYQRFGIPTINSKTFNSILKRESGLVYSDRGGHFIEIDPIALRKARDKSDLTQKQLAKKVGVSKKTIYEHEKEIKRANVDIVREIEKILGKVRKSISIKAPEKIEKVPRNKMEKVVYNQMKKLGFSVTSVQKAPFNLIAESKSMIISDIERDMRMIKKDAPQLNKFSNITEKSVAFISNSTNKENIEGVPIIGTEELKDIKTEKTLIKIIKERE